jgi:hypothetical protein
MNLERELLEKAADELEILEYRARLGNGELIADIREELTKPEHVMYQSIEVENGRQVFTWKYAALPDGKYKLYAERINE